MFIVLLNKMISMHGQNKLNYTYSATKEMVNQVSAYLTFFSIFNVCNVFIPKLISRKKFEVQSKMKQNALMTGRLAF